MKSRFRNKDKDNNKNEEILNVLEDKGITEEEFSKKYPSEDIVIPIYYTLNENKKVIIDYEEMQEQFEDELREILADVNPEVLE